MLFIALSTVLSDWMASFHWKNMSFASCLSSTGKRNTKTGSVSALVFLLRYTGNRTPNPASVIAFLYHLFYTGKITPKHVKVSV